MKKYYVITTMVLAAFVMASCAATPASAPSIYNMGLSTGPANFYSDTVSVGDKRGEATSKVWLETFGEETYPAVERVARENGITKIASVEYYQKPGVLYLWTEYKTIVTGE